MTIDRIVAIVLFFVALGIGSRLGAISGGVVLAVALIALKAYAAKIRREESKRHGDRSARAEPGRTVPASAPRAVSQSIEKPGQVTRYAGSEARPLGPVSASVMRAIEEQRRTDPLIGAKLGAKDVSRRLMNGMKSEKGVHIESLLCALGALAGYACQENLRAQAVEKGVPESAVFTIVKTSDGKQYFFGDPLNRVLAEAQYSVWGLAAGAAKRAGCNELPDIGGIFKHVSETLGAPSFGIPRYPEGHHAGDTPINYLKALWPALFPVAKQYCQKPGEWPLLFAFSIQDAIESGKSALAPEVALKIVMESAVPMSKVDLATI